MYFSKGWRSSMGIVPLFLLSGLIFTHALLSPTKSLQLSEASMNTRTIQMRLGVADTITTESPMKVAIAGGGVGGLMTARALQKHGIDVVIYERTAEFKRFGGPIQLASNALSTIKAIDTPLFENIMEKFTFTGVRTNGIKDGIRSEWYTKFDAITIAADEGKLPYTGVINRPDLQEIMLEHIGDCIHNGRKVAGYENLQEGGVKIILEDGTEDEADVLIGADGIWSQVRAQMWNEPVKEGSGATYSGYTVFAGETVHEVPDYWDVGYKVYIGPKQYFVTSDVGSGRMQWYAFIALPPGTKSRQSNKEYIRELFNGWSEEIFDVLDATDEDEIEQRDLYDRPPQMMKSWSDGYTTLIGDACHPMMPNLGQGGGQAMEDGFILARELAQVSSRLEIPNKLQQYYKKRIMRTSIVQGLSRFASDIIVTGFDTPCKVVSLWPLKIENFGPASILTNMLKPVMPLIFYAQFKYLYMFAPERIPDETREELVSSERARARVLATAAWEAKKAGVKMAGSAKQFSGKDSV
mmetsp:Transcript_21029/g.27625  ORF Transcript_21029/g.27625 Transcript_21029/m.27625 type:complete len:524 (+) Transcript_21029:103-1674(+)